MSHCGDGVAKLKKGADAIFFINLTFTKDGGPEQAFKLAAVPTQVQLRMPKDDGSVLRVELSPSAPGITVEDADGGILKVNLSETETDLLKGFDPDQIETQNMEILVKQDIPNVGTTEIFDLPDSLEVAVQRFPEP